MNYKVMNFLVKKAIISLSTLALLSFLPARRSAQEQQQPPSPEEMEKKRMEFIDKEKERLVALLDLEYYQEFWVDSTLTANVTGMQEEMMKLQSAKVSNYDMYIAVQDRWHQKTYDAYHRFFTEEQWAKYLKSGAAKEQQARDKRRDKAAGIKPDKTKKSKKPKK